MLQTSIKNNCTNTIEKSSENILNKIKKAIKKSKTSNMKFDISSLNLLDASKVATIASTYHYLKFNEGHIDWIVNSKEVESMLRPLSLGNSNFIFA